MTPISAAATATAAGCGSRPPPTQSPPAAVIAATVANTAARVARQPGVVAGDRPEPYRRAGRRDAPAGSESGCLVLVTVVAVREVFVVVGDRLVDM